MFEGRIAEARSIIRVTLDGPSRSGIKITPVLSKAIEECLVTEQDVVVIDDGVYHLVRPMHPVVVGGEDFNKFESVTILLLTGINIYAIRKES